MGKSAAWLLLAFLMAAAVYLAQVTVGFWAPVVFIIIATVAAVIGIVVDVRSRRTRA